MTLRGRTTIHRLKIFATAVAVTAAVFGAAGTAQADPLTPVWWELALVIDVSGSVDATEYALQRDGYRVAFQSASVGAAIQSFSASGGIAVGVYYFAQNTIEVIGWTHLDSAADAFAFGTALGALARPDELTIAIGGNADGSTLGVSTNVAEGIDRAREGILTNGFQGVRLVMDVSGDGRQNRSRDGTAICVENSLVCNGQTDAARIAAIGITINALAIVDDSADLAAWYAAHVQSGPESFLLSANFANVAGAIETKIVRDLQYVPVTEPATLSLLGLALAGLGARTRRRR